MCPVGLWRFGSLRRHPDRWRCCVIPSSSVRSRRGPTCSGVPSSDQWGSPRFVSHELRIPLNSGRRRARKCLIGGVLGLSLAVGGPLTWVLKARLAGDDPPDDAQWNRGHEPHLGSCPDIEVRCRRATVRLVGDVGDRVDDLDVSEEESHREITPRSTTSRCCRP